ncbi:hypothetical protein JTE90_007591 [Oedothorax gibbosus]|uniref:Uncharacterized protein n=1 Tax=Oedothorax gibbosus TaxID=931172 RepID=A0AAV6TMP2_9ARAC|nr:hypothetical protein JTE90_007591 [Oedothorax gibbosus]
MHRVIIHNCLKKSSLSNCTEDGDTLMLDFIKIEVKEMLEGSDDEHLTEEQIDMLFEDESFEGTIVIDESVPDSLAISSFTEECFSIHCRLSGKTFLAKTKLKYM